VDGGDFFDVPANFLTSQNPPGAMDGEELFYFVTPVKPNFMQFPAFFQLHLKNFVTVIQNAVILNALVDYFKNSVPSASGVCLRALLGAWSQTHRHEAVVTRFSGLFDFFSSASGCMRDNITL